MQFRERANEETDWFRIFGASHHTWHSCRSCLWELAAPIFRLDKSSKASLKKNRMARVIVVGLRLPRVLLAIMIGMALSLAGALLQAVMRNPLADPGIIGVSAGAAAAATSVMLLFPVGFLLCRL